VIAISRPLQNLRTPVDAARFYAATFPDSEVTAVHEAPADYPGGKEGDVLTVEFTVPGIPCLGLNGGPTFKHSEAFSFQIATDDQEETDRYWNAIVNNGGEEVNAVDARTAGASPGRSPRAC
jgi:predicted 3-demethylubiquinone-9 3-methyltransferase (glyoxalase superfamily)